MIGSITGTIEEIHDTYIIVNVSNIGYIVYISHKVLQTCKIGNNIKLYIETYVNRDNITQLYGFLNRQEQDYLRMLVTINGINYKTALSILSKLSPEQIFYAVVNNDKAVFKGNGIGDKLAGRIVTELQYKINKIPIEETFPIENDDALAALISLGYEKLKAFNVIQGIKSQFPGANTQELIRKALQKLS
ncbi:Holliday junction branch migration protein RuvA [Ehrlichia ruminantium]|uniref:Holliday junction branch migration complex subunit RuvA n=1 Tax=Ehrlichia ruminantium TaxID=779 RepID=A0AAE6QAT7_EHRRU|nr:Holliday junction branch migration protein RuvA [Ehrlichia ruminantium]QGR02732.1 Holliday junction branch migration protein RuvA [Ehrlichia ruminantium]QGR03652.1 Holliday junction branch migration protein RuvA [Ehrlichia ruminantium]QGR04579.1 Holliday junction branch migration protein RuvA [Ehrlichia ruminantium]